MNEWIWNFVFVYYSLSVDMRGWFTSNHHPDQFPTLPVQALQGTFESADWIELRTSPKQVMSPKRNILHTLIQTVTELAGLSDLCLGIFIFDKGS